MSSQRLSPEHLHVGGEPVEVRRSARRKRSVQAYRDGERIVVLVPAHLTHDQRAEWVPKMVERVLSQEQRRRNRQPRTDDALHARAAELSARLFEGAAKPTSIRWVTNQHARWGSCTPSTGQIRLSHRLQELPAWVIDYVIVHELAHLLEAGHGPRFTALTARYPLTAKAEGFLEGIAHAAGLAADWNISDDSEGRQE